ncbi:HlyD family efflux transporter periplasmic adaptor subunit [Algiphilus sp. NNCM1]|uniref:HlyD family efflux transporter periplasmic adaptor subunit n=1 Tax=Algiphilus sp. TaxID=1872431 RepID=UPI001CA7A97B|nr:HlyD family efflux transporter periplasmic adaptor subunit [Algiphilus sp.]MBY8967132.1 HlyD family efflux transporter periplasmic adaptor subunit [Algiphilus acroporae]MCI5062049.1 HlyD family efflux transporter periplasmic adaptor subunit [Algiphilus sp.]MCI5102594.1 HlyD family efflux transporter periplasmic adaptor subunit [Algiphilus sp.]
MITRERLFARTIPYRPGHAGRLLLLLIVLVVSFCAWASWATIEEQVRSPGKVVVSSSSQVVQAVDGGQLSELHVDEGDLVEKGELLARIDPARFQARAAETRAKIRGLKATIARLEAELNGRAIQFPSEVQEDQALVLAQRNLYERRRQQLRESQESLRRSLDLAQSELEALESLAETGDAARSEILRARREVSELRGELANKRNEYRQEAQEQLTNARSELDQTLEVFKQRQEALLATELRAPMSGKINNISFSTIGAVLQAGDEVLEIVPSDEPLIVEARVSSADVAFIRSGLPANVKLDAYDFTIYGSLKGEVTYISADTIEEDLERDEEPYYRVRIRIDEMPDLRGPNAVEVIPGMTCVTEIVTGERTVAQYLLKPLLRGSASAFTER